MHKSATIAEGVDDPPWSHVVVSLRAGTATVAWGFADLLSAPLTIHKLRGDVQDPAHSTTGARICARRRPGHRCGRLGRPLGVSDDAGARRSRDRRRSPTWLDDAGAGWDLNRDLAFTIEAVVALATADFDRNCTHPTNSSRATAPSSTTTPASSPPYTVRRVAAWHATTDAPDQAETERGGAAQPAPVAGRTSKLVTRSRQGRARQPGTRWGSAKAARNRRRRRPAGSSSARHRPARLDRQPAPRRLSCTASILSPTVPQGETQL